MYFNYTQSQTFSVAFTYCGGKEGNCWLNKNITDIILFVGNSATVPTDNSSVGSGRSLDCSIENLSLLVL